MSDKKLEDFMKNIKGYIKEKHALEFNEKELNYIYNLGAKKCEIGDYEGAEPLFQFLSIYQPNNPLYLKAMGGCYQGLEQFAIAIPFFTLAYALDQKKQLDCLFYIGFSHLKNKNPQEAKQILTKFIELAGEEHELVKKAKLFLNGLK